MDRCATIQSDQFDLELDYLGHVQNEGDNVNKTAAAMSTVAAATAFFTTFGVGTASATPMFHDSYQMDYGSNYTYGDVLYYQRSVGITGTVRGDNQCAQVRFSAVYGEHDATYSQTRTACDREVGFNFTIDPNVVGGIKRVGISLWTKPDTEGGTWTSRRYVSSVNRG